MSQSSSNSYWIVQENGTDQPKMYRRTRSMLKIRCTDVWQPRHDYSQLTQNQKAKFQTPYISNEARNSVEHKSVNKMQAILSARQNHTFPLFLILYFQKKGRKSQKTFLHLQKMYLHLHLYPHWRQ